MFADAESGADQGVVGAYAIVRIDGFLGPDAPLESKITIKAVVGDLAEAEREVERLNGLVQGRDVTYFWQYTRYSGRRTKQ